MPAIVTLLNPHRRGSRRRGNPGHLLIVNGKRRTAMAARKRNTRRRVSKKPATRVSNPRRRTRRANSRHTTVVNHRRRANRRRNPSVKRVNRRRRNPALKGVFEGMIVAGIGMAITDVVQGFVPASMLPGGAVAKIGVRLGLAWLVGAGAEKFGFAKYANLLAIGGAVGAFQDTFRLLFGGMLAPAPAPQQPLQLAPGQVMVPAGADSDMGDITYFPQGFGDITYAPNAQWLYE